MRMLLAVAGLLALASEGAVAQQTQPTPSAQSAPAAAVAVAALAGDVAPLVSRTAMALMFTRMIGVTGIEKAPTAAVKQVSADVASANTALLGELRAIAAVSGLSTAIPDVLDRGYADQAELLQSSFETQFEHEYLGMQIEAHRQMVGLLADGRALAAVPAMQPVAVKIAGRLATQLAVLEAAKRNLPAM